MLQIYGNTQLTIMALFPILCVCENPEYSYLLLHGAIFDI